MSQKEPSLMTHRRKTVLRAVGFLVAMLLVVMPVFTVILYHEAFGGRLETDERMAYAVRAFPGLQMTECSFPSNHGQMLAGYRYSRGEKRADKGLVVLAHGIGGGQNAYMNVADYFTSQGFLVFAYDATGTDKSEGASMEGLPQGVIDLDYALRYVKQCAEYQDLPIALFGHSWGGYCVGNVLNYHPDVRAAVLVAGFDRSTDLIEQQGETMIGFAIHLFMPYLSLYERLRFGEYAAFSVMDGFAASDAGVMVVHSRDDRTVLPENGFDRFFDVYGEDPRFSFVEYEDRGHNKLLDSVLMEQIVDFYLSYCCG